MPTPLALAVDFGGTKVESALVDADGTVVPGSRHRQPTGRTATSEALEQSVATVVRDALPTVPADAEVDRHRNRLRGPDRARGRARLPAQRARLARTTRCGRSWRGVAAAAGHAVPAALEMDGVAITLAEHWVGAAQGVDNVMGMVVSTGIGGGLIVGGRVITGPTGNAGHIGHVEVGGMTGEDTFGNPDRAGGDRLRSPHRRLGAQPGLHRRDRRGPRRRLCRR